MAPHLDDELDLDFGWRDGAFRLEVASRTEPADRSAVRSFPKRRRIRARSDSSRPRSTTDRAGGTSRRADVDDPRGRAAVRRVRRRRQRARRSGVRRGRAAPTRPVGGAARRRCCTRSPTEFASDRGTRRPSGDVRRHARPRPSDHVRAEGADRPDRARYRVEGARLAAPGGIRRPRADQRRRRLVRRLRSARSRPASSSTPIPTLPSRNGTRLLGDPSRTVRRATVDAMVDAARPGTAPPPRARARRHRRVDALEGASRPRRSRHRPSRAVVAPLAEDPDFRVRLEAAGALRDRGA